MKLNILGTFDKVYLVAMIWAIPLMFIALVYMLRLFYKDWMNGDWEIHMFPQI